MQGFLVSIDQYNCAKNEFFGYMKILLMPGCLLLPSFYYTVDTLYSELLYSEYSLYSEFFQGDQFFSK